MRALHKSGVKFRTPTNGERYNPVLAATQATGVGGTEAQSA